MKRIAVLLAAMSCLLLPVRNAASAESFPNRAVRIVVPYTPAGGTDIVARLFAERLRALWGQPVTVENRPGADGIIGSEVVARASADGYTLLLVVAAHVINPSIKLRVPFDVIKDFSPVTLIAASPWVVVVNNEVRATTISELIALAKSGPQKLTFGSSDPSSRLAVEQFKSMAGIELNHVPYKGAAPVIADLLGGHIQLSFSSVVTSLSQYRSGKLRAIAVTGANRSDSMPEVPTVIESGLRDFEAGAWYGLYGPAGLPEEVARRIHADIAKIAAEPEVRARLQQLGAHAVTSTPAEFSVFTAQEQAKFARIVKAAGIAAE